MNDFDTANGALSRPIQASAFAAPLLNSPAVEVDESEGEILLHLALPGNAATLIDFAAARVMFHEGRLRVHLPKLLPGGEAEEKAEGRRQKAEENGSSAPFPGEGNPFGKLGDHYVPSASEDHISQQQAIEARADMTSTGTRLEPKAT